jgi:hypothetical protein
METGTPKDSNNNAADFILVATDPAPFGGAARLGAPGPENTTSPLPKLLPLLPGLLIDPTVGSASSPNRTRDTTPYTDALTPSGPDGSTATPYALGTLSVQRRVLNNTGQPVTRLRFRVIEVTTLSTPYYSSSSTQADVRVLSSNGTTRAPSVLPPGVSLKGVTLEHSGGR